MIKTKRRKLFQTTTVVHTRAEQKTARITARAHENDVMLATIMGAQILAMGALYLLPTAATAAWWSALLLFVPMLGLFFLSRAAAAKMPENALDLPIFKVFAGIFALLFLTDMALCLSSFIELTCTFVLIDASRRTLSLIAAAALSLAAPADRGEAPARTALFLRGFFIFAFVFCAFTVLGQGNSGFLYPTAGYGIGHSLKCTVTMSGSVWSAAALPMLSKSKAHIPPAKHVIQPMITVLLLLSALFLCCAFILPGTALSARFGYPIRLQMLMMVSPSVISWSLMLLCEMLLFAVAFTASGACAVRCLKSALGKNMPLMVLALFCLPLAIRGMDAFADALITLFPFRYALAAAMTLIALLYGLIKEKKA